MTSLTAAGKNFIRKLLPFRARLWIAERRQQFSRMLLPFDRVTSFEVLRRTTPVRRNFGLARGQSVDRHYIEHFLGAHAQDIRGRVLEIQNDVYTRKFGGNRVTQSEVLDVDAANRRATIVADLAGGDLPVAAFDCVICTQTLLLIYDVKAAVRTLHRTLKPGGVLLVTVPGVAHPVCHALAGDYWRFTSISARRLFSEVFVPEHVEVTSHGNVLAAVAFLHGLVVEELTTEELEFCDPEYEVTIAVRAVKAASGGTHA